MLQKNIKAVSGELTIVTPISANITLPAVKVNVTMGAKTTSEEALAAVDTLCEAYNQANQGLCGMRVLIGRTIKEVRDRKLFQPQFANFEDYLAHIDQTHGLSRSVVQDAILGVTVFPKAKPEDVKDMKVVNFTRAARAAKHADPKQAAVIFKEAAKLSVNAFQQKMENDGFLQKRGRPDGGHKTSGPVQLRIMVSAAIAKRFRALAAAAGGDEGTFFRSLLLSRGQAA